MVAKRFEVGRRALLKLRERTMRELTNAELDLVAGGLTNKTGSCGTTAGFATTRSTSCGSSGENLVRELVVDILRVLESNNCGGSSPKKAQLAA
jgi:hypothetical protein